MPTNIRVVGIAGSLRANSFNRALLHAAGQLMPEGMQLEILEIGDLPIYNQDLEGNPPESVIRIHQQVSAADALILSTPEFNYTIPAVLKNAIEWLSRPLPVKPLDRMPTAIMGIGGRAGTSRAQATLRQIGVSANMLMLNQPEILVVNTGTQFDAQGNLVDESVRRFLRQQMEALDRWVRLLRGEEVKV